MTHTRQERKRQRLPFQQWRNGTNWQYRDHLGCGFPKRTTHLQIGKPKCLFVLEPYIYIKTFLANESRDVKNRLVPVSFMTKVYNPVHAFDRFAKNLEEYGDCVDVNVLDNLKKALEHEYRKRLTCLVLAALVAFTIII